MLEEKARILARKIIQPYIKKGKAPPTPLLEICRSLGVEVRYMDFSSIHGLYFRFSHPIIFIPRCIPKVRQRFSIAHELGHILLGHPPSLLYERNKNDLEEREANIFASELLMPKPLIYRLGHKFFFNAKLLSLIFRVSEESMKIRLRELGLIEK